jgi:hypothetical protein
MAKQPILLKNSLPITRFDDAPGGTTWRSVTVLGVLPVLCPSELSGRKLFPKVEFLSFESQTLQRLGQRPA